ncbi:LysR family transcriptional regulator [Clostridium sp. AN503]|uniref:LysR family transcriptional regulator n=1 Tax=Clostridium sp. AN503 TaxID=3160598 RepID=UPI0034590739
MDFRDYAYVQAIADYKTISRAAEALYISQPSLTKFLQKLEAQLETPLFARINKQMYPTYAGEKFLETGQAIFALQARLDRTISQIASHENGRISLTTTTTRGYYVLPRILPLFKKLYPGYHIDIKERSVSDVEQNLRDGTTDLAIYALPVRNPEFKYFHINTEEVVLCLAGSSPYTELAEIKSGFKHPWLDLKHLEHEIFFLNDPLQWRIGQISRQLLREAGIQPEITELRNLETCLSLASGGLGFTFCFDISEACFRNYTKPPAYLSVGNEPHTAEFVVGYRQDYRLTKADQDFLNLLRREFGPQNTVAAGLEF